MVIKINEVEHNVPSDLSQIPLGKFIEWYNVYGRNLDEELNAIFQKEQDVFETEIDLQLHVDKEALSWYTFFTGFDFFKCSNIELTDLFLQYRILRDLLKESENEAKEFPAQIEWNGEIWAIQDFRINPGSTMSFNEVVTSKEIVRQINKIGQGKWDALLYLCCIWFRKKDEPFVDELTRDERLKLMETLPLNYALMVAFFLSSSISIFRHHLLYLQKEAVEKRQQN